jgi:hypothetical protein
MPGIFTKLYEYYYIVLILQGFCLFHSFRRGIQQKWLWIIVFLPLVGSIIYIFSEIINKRDVSSIQNSIQSNVTSFINPTGRIRKFEKKLKFSNTFANKVNLADAYFDNRQYDKAIELYETSLTGVFQDNEHVIKQLVQCYFPFERYEDIIRLAPKIKNTIDFSKSRANFVYAIALEKTGKIDLAEHEFKKMNHTFSNYEQRYAYGEFLLRLNKKDEAVSVFTAMINEAQHLSRREIGSSRSWIEKAGQEVEKLNSVSIQSQRV